MIFHGFGHLSIDASTGANGTHHWKMAAEKGCAVT